MSKFEMVPWNPLSSHLNHVSLQGVAEAEHLANVRRVKDKETRELILLGSFYVSPNKEETLGFL